MEWDMIPIGKSGSIPFWHGWLGRAIATIQKGYERKIAGKLIGNTPFNEWTMTRTKTDHRDTLDLISESLRNEDQY